MNWHDIIAEATIRSYDSLDQDTRDEVSFYLVRPPATEGLKRWWQLLER